MALRDDLSSLSELLGTHLQHADAVHEQQRDLASAQQAEAERISAQIAGDVERCEAERARLVAAQEEFAELKRRAVAEAKKMKERWRKIAQTRQPQGL